MPTPSFPARCAATLLLTLVASAAQADPLLSSWFTTYSAKYARIFTNNTTEAAGTSVTTWTNGSQTQSSPAYCGIQEIDYDASWLYVTTTGLGSHLMGPWSNGSFPNLPTDQQAVYKIPRVTDFTSSPTTKTLTGGGVIGYFVDGVGMFDSRDAFYWNGTTNTQGTGYWNRDAYVNEGPTFDPAYAHQQNTGTYHYHADPIGLRYLLGDHVTYNATTNGYAESTAPATAHSPILGWAADGCPIYGPYGYSSALDATSAVTRMRTGYVQRNGSNGTDNLTVTGRTSIPQWAINLGYSYSGAPTTGPTVSSSEPLGTYLEDNSYLGDLIKSGTTYYQQGVDFDLDMYNGRYCVTPDYPGGVYAYFSAINASGTPVFPYNIGRAFRGYATGTSTTVPGTATNYIKSGPATPTTMTSPVVNQTTGNVALTWSSVEGGTYKLEATNDLTNWTTLSSTLAAATDAVQTGATDTGAATANAKRFYRITLTALAAYDTGGGWAAGAPAVVTSAPTNITSSSATLNGTVAADTYTTTVSFDYGLTTSYGSSAVASPATLTGTTVTSVSASLTGLTANATYHYRVKATNSAGTTYGSDESFTAALTSDPVAPGGFAYPGATVTLTITLPTNPPLPPANLVPAVTLAGTSANSGSVSRPSQDTVIATFTIPANAPLGAQNIVVTFTPNPTYTMTGAFTIE